MLNFRLDGLFSLQLQSPICLACLVLEKFSSSRQYMTGTHICHLGRHSLYEGIMKSSSLAYNRRETRDKRLLGRDPDRGCKRFYSSVKLLWSQPMSPWSSAAGYECAAAQSMTPWTATKKAVTPASVRVPTQRPLVPSST